MLLKSIVYSITCQVSPNLRRIAHHLYNILYLVKLFRFCLQFLSVTKEIKSISAPAASLPKIASQFDLNIQTEKLSGLFSTASQIEVLSHSISIIIPSRDVDGNEFDPSEMKAFLYALFSQLYGGCSAYCGLGSWINDKGKLITEEIVDLRSSASNPRFSESLNTVGPAILYLKSKYNQGKISVAIDGQMLLI